MASAWQMEGITNKGLIGRGAFGAVYLVENNAKEEFAVKVMEMLLASFENQEMAKNEVTILEQLAHDNVLIYVGSVIHQGLIYIITEYCRGGDLSGFLDQLDKPVPEDLLLVWLWQMACGLEYMHKHEPCSVLHRDLKPSNIYLTDTGDIRLGDMGIARILHEPDAMARTFCGTPAYMSPEALNETPYNSKTDIWSLGCCVVEMATLQRAYDGTTLYILKNAVLRMREPLPRQYSRDLDNLVSKMLNVNFRERITATNLLDDPLMADYETIMPQDLLDKHNLTEHLAMHRSSRWKSRAGDDMTLETVTDGTASLSDILVDGESITSYRKKVDTRMRGRRRDTNSTLRADGNMETVLCKSGEQTKKKKTQARKPSVPSLTKQSPTEPKSSNSSPAVHQNSHNPPAEPQVPDDLFRRLTLSSCMSTLTSSMQSMRRDANPSQRQQSDTTPGPVNSTDSVGVGMIRSVLTQLLGTDSLREAQQILTSRSSTQEMESGLRSILGQQGMAIKSVVVYIVLLDAMSQQGLGS